MKWTPELDAEIRRLYHNHSQPEIAELMSLTRGQVRSRLSTLGLAEKAKPWSDADIERLCQAYAAAPTSDRLLLDRLAKLFERHKANVCRKARSLGLTNQARPKVAQLKITATQNVYATPEERSKANSDRVRKHIAENGHPRGALGMKHTPEAKAKMVAALKRAWADPTSGHNAELARQGRSDRLLNRIAAGEMNTKYSRTRGGRREDMGGRYFRSAWEANYARYLNFMVQRGEIASWEYECKTFVFEAIKRGTRAYTPDFKVLLNGGGHEWHEVKGWMDAKSKTRLARMQRYFPDEKIVVLDSAWFRAANKGPLPGLIPGWESGTTR